MTRYSTPAGSMSVEAELIREAGLVRTYDQRGTPILEYALAGDMLVFWPDTSSSVLSREEFDTVFPRQVSPQPSKQEAHAR